MFLQYNLYIIIRYLITKGQYLKISRVKNVDIAVYENLKVIIICEKQAFHIFQQKVKFQYLN